MVGYRDYCNTVDVAIDVSAISRISIKGNFKSHPTLFPFLSAKITKFFPQTFSGSSDLYYMRALSLGFNTSITQSSTPPICYLKRTIEREALTTVYSISTYSRSSPTSNISFHFITRNRIAGHSYRCEPDQSISACTPHDRQHAKHACLHGHLPSSRQALE